MASAHGEASGAGVHASVLVAKISTTPRANLRLPTPIYPESAKRKSGPDFPRTNNDQPRQGMFPVVGLSSKGHDRQDEDAIRLNAIEYAVRKTTDLVTANIGTKKTVSLR